jgi:hypothetical protein
MKIRIKGNSLRYRLSKTEVELFIKEGYIQECIYFGAIPLVYALRSTLGGELNATFYNNKITLLMPDTMVNAWANTECVGFESNTTALYLLVEKDFMCLDNVLEDQSDNYPNPNMLKC